MVKTHATTQLQLIDSLQQTLIQGLACAALQPGLRNILIFDSSPIMLQAAVNLWTEMLSVTTQKSVKLVYLGVTDTEETLWGNLALTHIDKAQPFIWQTGLLGNDSTLRIIVIPDLSRLSLAAARACITLMGTEVAHVERHGHQACWRTNLCWIAGCPRFQVKYLSPHLLDRFALRLSGHDLQMCNRTQSLYDWLSSCEEPIVTTPMLPNGLRHRLKESCKQTPILTNAVYQQGLTCLIKSRIHQGFRRELTLIRLAKAQAQLAGVPEVTTEHIKHAGKIIGLHYDSKLEKRENSNQSVPIINNNISQVSLSHTNKQSCVMESYAPIYLPDSEIAYSTEHIDLSQSQGEPYPEDNTPTERKFGSLRLPFRRFRKNCTGRGPIIGVEPATTAQDIAWVSTLLESAKYQAVRTQDSSELILQTSDLRRYRRAVIPGQLLTIVLDHTSLKNCQWQEALLPYLQRAYIERANICLVQVGSTTVNEELQAKKVNARSILVPHIQAAFEHKSGLATPLAHGLNLALQNLRHTLQHGRSKADQALLIVLTNGLGNIPLEASQKNKKPSYPVNRQGIEDALKEAKKIQLLKQVETVLISPHLNYCKELPTQLAQALGAKILLIPPLNN